MRGMLPTTSRDPPPCLRSPAGDRSRFRPSTGDDGRGAYPAAPQPLGSCAATSGTSRADAVRSVPHCARTGHVGHLRGSGGTYCLSVRAIDVESSISDWRPARVQWCRRTRPCWTPLHAGGEQRTHASTRNALATSQRAATLMLPGVEGTTVVLVATTCPTCGPSASSWIWKTRMSIHRNPSPYSLRSPTRVAAAHPDLLPGRGPVRPDAHQGRVERPVGRIDGLLGECARLIAARHRTTARDRASSQAAVRPHRAACVAPLIIGATLARQSGAREAGLHRSAPAAPKARALPLRYAPTDSCSRDACASRATPRSLAYSARTARLDPKWASSALPVSRSTGRCRSPGNAPYRRAGLPGWPARQAPSACSPTARRMDPCYTETV